MKHKILAFLIILLVQWSEAIGQPIALTNPPIRLDFDNNGTTDFQYGIGAEKTRDIPETWMVSYAVEPWGDSRLLRASNARFEFHPGEIINNQRGALTNYIYNNPRPPIETYGILLLFYRSIKQQDWVYATAEHTFEKQSDLLIGVNLIFGSSAHYGWVRLSRQLVDNHTPFELIDYAVHPVPDEPIAAGQPPPLPPIQTQMDAESLTFSWDARWGPLVLESTTSLVPPITWETFVEGSGGPVAIPTEDEQRFYRLRQP